MTEVLEAVDVVVVGAGAAGSVYAAILAEAGKSVLLLERGVERKLTDLYSSQVWARRLKWGGPVIESEGPDNISFNFNAGHGYGGAALHHYAVWPRFHEEDFRERTLYKRSLDWPFDYAALRPFYDQVQRDVGICGDAAQEIWRPPGDPYPLPPALVTNHGKVLARGFQALRLSTAPIPIAVLSRPYQGRQPCIWDGWCDAGCPIGALANPLATYIPRARKAGAVLKADTYVSRVLTDKTGRRATAVEYFTGNGKRMVQPASAVVLCASTVENARILLNSFTQRHPNGLSNGSGLLGKYLMCHSGISIYGMFAEPMQNHLGATGGQLLCQDPFGKQTDPTGAFGSRQWTLGLALKPNDLLGIAQSRPELFGSALEKFMRAAAQSMGCMVGVCQDQPQLHNRIELAQSKDRFGLPRAKVTYATSTDGVRLWQSAAKQGVEIFRAAGSREAWHSGRGSQHILGGTIMGNDPATSVLNGVAQSHEVGNLFVGGGGAFPTSSAVSPTFTVHALAMKSARFMTQEWKTL